VNGVKVGFLIRFFWQLALPVAFNIARSGTS
jgi:hypothetical protein